MSLFKIILQSSFFTRKGTSNNDTIILLGTGPSFSKNLEEDLDILCNHDTMGLNHFVDKEQYDVIKPRYYMIGAPEIWQKGLNDYYTDKGIKTFKHLNEKTTWPMDLFLGISAKKSKRTDLISNPNINIVYINRTPIEGIKNLAYFLFNRRMGMPRPHNVLVPSIMSSIWMGKKTICLIGADHSWHEQIRINKDNTVELKALHYFDKKESWNTMKRKGKRDRKIYEIFEKFMLSFKAYNTLEDYSKKNKVKIYNCSSYSYIDAFERKSLKDVFAK